MPFEFPDVPTLPTVFYDGKKARDMAQGLMAEIHAPGLKLHAWLVGCWWL